MAGSTGRRKRRWIRSNLLSNLAAELIGIASTSLQ
jgi:hypothetical protein